MASSIFPDTVAENIAGRLRFEPSVEPPPQKAMLQISRRDESLPAPLSWSQERLWFLDQIELGAASAHLARGLRITGKLKHDVLNRSLATIVQRHESLRTTFAITQLYAGVDSKPSQLISIEGKVELSIVDLTSLKEDEQDAKARELARLDAQAGFDLTIGPLLRVTLLVLAPEEHILLLTVHRIVCDDRSLGLLLCELWQTYGTLAVGSAAQSPPMSVQFADYGVWQRETLTEAEFNEHRQFWQTKLAGAPPLLELPADHPRPSVQNWRGASTFILLDEKLSHALTELAQSEGTSLFVTLLAAFQVLLARYCHRTDIVVGSQFESRDAHELINLIGPVSNALALRTDLSSKPSFTELLAQVDQNVRDALSHQAMPFARLVDELAIERSLSFAPVFQVGFNLRKPLCFGAPLRGLLIEDFEFETGISSLDLTLDVQQGRELKLRFEYDTGLFEGDTIERLGRHFEILLRSIVKNPDEQIDLLQILAPQHLKRILYEWNHTSTTEAPRTCVHELFEASAAKTPHAPALVFAQDRLTYSELNHRANQLAHHLRKVGVGPERRVGVYLERSVNNVVALLAILKAGGAYVPIDPAYPQERVSYMLADSRVAVLITQESLAGRLPEHQANVVVIDRDWPSNETTDNPENLSTPENLAYVIYTSGSTGRPKGVAIEHRSTATFLQWALNFFSGSELSSVLLSTSFCFDLSVFELFAPLSAGGKVILVENALQLPNLNGEEVTLVNTVPSAMTELVRLGGITASVQTINLAGESLSKCLVDEIYERTQARQVLNLYGPSEDTTYSTYVRVKRDAAGEPTIGRPVSNTAAYILDREGQPVPVGVPGELHLSGAGLARGYLNRPELTAEKFIPDPYSGSGGARMYRTGDLARYRADGEIEFLGRIDHQVKLRGYRIELGEIEAVLSQDPQVAQVVAIVREDQPGDKRLVAYIVPHPGVARESLTSSTLRSLLAERLPEYMIPSAFVVLEALPLTPNGKIDRRSLPKPEEGRSGIESSYVAPRDNLERQLANIWEKILGKKGVGVQDSFFELGGHSLLALRLFAQLENRFGKRLPLTTLFQSTTIEQLAGVLRENKANGLWSSLVPIQPKGPKPPLFCIHAAGANVLIYRPLSRHLGEEQPVYALQARGLDGEQLPYFYVEEMAAHYIREIRAFQPEGPYHLLGASFGGLVIFEMAMQLLRAGQQVGLLAMLNTNCPVYPLNRKVLIHLSHLKHDPLSYARAVGQALQRRFGLGSGRSETKTADATLSKLVEEPRQSDAALTRTILAILEAERDYMPRGKLYAGKITLFKACDYETDFMDNRLGWEKLSQSGLEVHDVPGTHTSMREEPHVAVLAKQLAECLALQQKQQGQELK